MVCGQSKITFIGAVSLLVSEMIGPGLVTSKSHDFMRKMSFSHVKCNKELNNECFLYSSNII
jgi:hypothetical protein